MNKPEIQPLVPLSSRGLEISPLLRTRHHLPLPILALVPPDIVLLGRKVQKDIVSRNRNKKSIASSYKENINVSNEPIPQTPPLNTQKKMGRRQKNLR